MNCCLTAADISMNILLQNKKTLTYITDLSKPTMQALFFCFNRHLKNMQILAEFLNPRLNFTMPVTDLRGG
jgi:hypothetical protein